MPPSGRKSSLSSSRNGPKKYIPYRADDFQHGKKTGIAVAYVDTTDEFEPFEKVMSQADQRTPFRPQGARKKRGPKTPVPAREEEQFDDDDENGEMSMELDDGAPCPGVWRRLRFLTCSRRYSRRSGHVLRAYTRQYYHVKRAARRLVLPSSRAQLGR